MTVLLPAYVSQKLIQYYGKQEVMLMSVYFNEVISQAYRYRAVSDLLRKSQ